MSKKLLKSELKEIVKECLVEILSEGIATSSRKSTINENRKRKPLPSQKQSVFDHTSWAKENSEQDKKIVNARAAASSLTSDPILAEVLADSQQTMMNQMAAEKHGASTTTGDFAQRKAAESDPLALFGESASKWAALASLDNK